MTRSAIIFLLTLGLLQTAGAFEEEIKFVEGLTEKGFPKLARTVLDRTLQKFPAASAVAPELGIRILIAENKFASAAEQIVNPQSSIVNQSPLWLFLAETAYAANRKPAAETAYQNYFENLTEAAEATGQAAFNYGELLEERGDDAAAKKVYEQFLNLPNLLSRRSVAKADGNSARPVKARLAALLVEEDPARALKLTEEVQLGGLDLWFGQAVVTWSQLMVNKEEWDEAQSVLETQLELLKQLEAALEAQGQPVSLVSPLSGARYWLGICYEHEDKKAEALTQFYNVYAKYGDSEWGPLAQEKAQALKEYFEAQGKTVNIDLGANLAKMEESTFRVARRLFFDRQYADAVPVYLDALNEFPEGSEAITALRELTLSAIYLNDELSAKTVGLYLSERFTEKPKAGEALLAAGKGALDAKQEPLAWWMYDRTIEAFPNHPRVPAVLYSLAGLRKNEEYLKKIIADYPDSSYHARALGRLAWNAYADKDYETAAARFAPYVDTETDLQKQTRARFAFAESYRFSKHWKKSLEVFQGLEKSMADAAKSYGASKETLAFNQPFHEKAVYYQAVCQKELGEINEAVALCDRFEEKFPMSGILEQVRFTKGKTLVEGERFDEALVALEGLGGEFEEPSLYYRGLALFETGAYEESFQTLEKLLMNFPASALTYEAMFVQGRAYVAAGRRDDAIRVLGEILNFASDDLLIHRASLELGRAQSDPAEKLASFQRVALLADPENEEHAPLIADALFESLPLYLELARADDLLADADRLTTEFPMFGNLDEINALREQAKQKKEEGLTKS